MEQTDNCKRGEGGAGCLKEGEGTSQRTHMQTQGHGQQCGHCLKELGWGGC